MEAKCDGCSLSQGLSLALVLAIALSMVFVATPVSAAGFVGTNYSGKVIKVVQGGIFVLRTELVWDEEEVPGYYGITIVWEDNNRADENFTVLYARAFIDNDGDNLPGPSPIWLENTTELLSGSGTNGRRWTFKIYNTTGDLNDGYFDVEIYMQAASRGTPHRAPWDNHCINKSGWGGSIDYAESTIGSVTPVVTTIRVLSGGVMVTVDPEYQSDLPGITLNYTVTVTNTGGVEDNYALIVSDNSGWGPTLDDNRFENVAPGEARATTLRVTIPENAVPCTEDNITVTAVGTGVTDSDSCIAHAASPLGVEVSISPDNQGGTPGSTLNYIVTITNTGGLEDSYDLAVSDNMGWGPIISPTSITVPAGENRTSTLSVTIPEDAIPCTEDNITVTATSTENSEISDSASCVAHVLYPGAIFVQGKDTAYSYNNNPPAPIKTYVKGDCPPMMMAQQIVSGRVVASGVVTEYRLNPSSDNFAELTDAIFRWLAPGQERVEISVLWFDGGYVPGDVYITSAMAKNLLDKLRSKGYTITGFNAPITSGKLAPHDILVLPEMQLGRADNGGNPDLLPDNDVQVIKQFVENDGKGLLIMSGSDFFGPSGNKGNFFRVMNKVLINLGFGWENKLFGFQSDSVYDDVNNSRADTDVPTPGGDAYRPIVDVITAHPIGAAYQAATGRTTVRAYGGCSLVTIGPGIAVYIIPSYQVGMPGDTLTYRVRIFNTGSPIPGAENVDLTIDLTISDNSGWGLTLDNYVIWVPEGETRTVMLSVTIPGGVPLSTEDRIVVTAAAREYPVTENYVCITCAGKRLEVTEDSYVSDWDPIANYGGENYLSVGRYENFWQYAYLKFGNLAEIPPGANIIEARLYLYCYSAYGSPQEVLADKVEDDDWDENTICWDYRPPPGATLDTTIVSVGAGLEPKAYYWDVTSFVRQEFAGDKVTSFCVRPADNCPPSTNRRFESREWWDNRVHPFLRIIYTVPPAIKWDALITATFSSSSDDAIFGVRPNASSGFDSKYDVPEPPAPPEPPYVRAYFYYPEQTPDELHRSCLMPENLMEWPLRVEYSEGPTDITLTWIVENIPSEYSVLLYRGGDLVADMRAEDHYTFEASAGSYDFRIVVGTIVPFTLELTQGWNMISLPVAPQNPDPDVIFGGAYYVMYRWDAENKRYVLHADSGDFVEPDPNVEVGVGYWIFSLENRDVIILGLPLTQLTLNLRTGWNMVGSLYHPSSIADPADDPDGSVLPWAFTWDASQRRYTMGQLLEPGKGYWVYALGDCSLILPKAVFKIAVVSDIGGRGDLSFNDMAFKGGDDAERDFGVEMMELISKTEADYTANLRTAASDPDVKLIVGVGFLLTNALCEVAGEFPEKNFVGIDTYTKWVEPQPNLLDVIFEEHKGSALVGVLGGLLAAYYDKPHIGAVLGIEIPVLWRFEIGYKWGCDWAMSWIENNKPEMEQGIYNTPRNQRVLWTYTGTFENITMGYLAAKPMYSMGAVAVYNIAGPLGLGINQAVQEIAEAENLENGPPFWIGVDADQDWINPGFVIASMMKRVDYGVYYTTKLVLEDKFREAVTEYGNQITLGIGTTVLGMPMEGISVSTLDDLDAFIEMGIDAGIIDPGNRDAIYAKVKAMREAQPSWIWDAVAELENKIRTGVVEVPKAETLDVVNYWRDILG